MANIIGISETELDSIIQAMNVDIIRIATIFEMMEELVDESKSYSNDEIGNAIRNKFGEFRDEFPKIKNNLDSYVNDLKQVKINYRDHAAHIKI